MQTINQAQFETSSFYLACYLICQGIKLVQIKKPFDSKRSVFVFEFSPQIDELARRFNFDKDTTVKLQEFINSQKLLKNALFDNSNNKYKNENEYEPSKSK